MSFDRKIENVLLKARKVLKKHNLIELPPEISNNNLKTISKRISFHVLTLFLLKIYFFNKTIYSTSQTQ